MNLDKDPRELRKLIVDASHFGSIMDGGQPQRLGNNPSGALIRNVLTWCEIQGYSGEDTMTVLAYAALTQYGQIMGKLFDDAVMTAPKLFVCAACAAKLEGMAP